MRKLLGPVCGLLIFLACVAMLVFTSLPKNLAPAAPVAKVVLAADPSTKPAADTPHLAEQARAALGLCGEEVGDAVMGKLNRELYTGSGPARKDEVDRRAERIRCIREWLKTGVTDPCQKSQYEEWLDYYSGVVKRQRKELEAIAAGKPVENPQLTWEEERRKKDRTLADYEAKHPVPVAPSCELDVIQRQK